MNDTTTITSKHKFVNALDPKGYSHHNARAGFNALDREEFDYLTLSMNAGAKFTVYFTTDTFEVLHVCNSKDIRCNYMRASGELDLRCYGGAKHHLCQNYLSMMLVDLGLEKTIQRVGEGVRCACCGCPLKDDLSIARGIGPVCFDKLFGTMTGWGRVLHNRRRLI